MNVISYLEPTRKEKAQNRSHRPPPNRRAPAPPSKSLQNHCHLLPSFYVIKDSYISSIL